MADHPQTECADNEAKLLAGYLADRDVPCAMCGQNLRGVQSGTCPECGEQIVIKVGFADHSTMSWILAMALYGLAAGISGLIAVGEMMTIALNAAYHLANLLSVFASVAAFTVAIVGFVVIAQERTRIWTSGIIVQCLVVLSVLLVPLAAFVVVALGTSLLGNGV